MVPEEAGNMVVLLHFKGGGGRPMATSLTLRGVVIRSLASTTKICPQTNCLLEGVIIKT